jgi:sphingomyelin phosphodiesterase acid-like 3
MIAAAVLLIVTGSIRLWASSSNLLVLSDLHFNPLIDPSQAKELAVADISKWPSILSQHSAALSRYGEDTNWALFHLVLHRATTLPDRPKLVLVTGDLFAHHLRQQYDRNVSDGPEFAIFAQKFVFFLARELKAALPGVPVVIALGNNDGDCADGDYSIEPGGRFLHETLPAVADALGIPEGALEEGWNSLGSYDIPHPTLSRQRLIVLNSTFFSWRYQNACGEKTDDPGARLLGWLEKRLSLAQGRNEKVWLVYHIPPGIDGYASTHQHAPNGDRVITLWNTRYQAAFETVLQRYGATVQSQFAGHTHFDDFRLLGSPGAYSGFVLINPGISPNVRQNPALRVIDFRSDGILTDAKTWYLPLAETNPKWKLAYQFRREWTTKAVDLSTLVKLYPKIRDTSKVRSQWEEVYSVWSATGKHMSAREFAATWCAEGNAHADDFRTCFCQSDPTGGFCQRTSSGANAPATARSPLH